MKAKKYASLDNVVVRTEGTLKKDYTGAVFGYFTVIKHVGFNFRDKSVYLIQDVFGDTFSASANQFTKTYFGTRFYTKESRIRIRKLRACYYNMIRRCYDPVCPGYKCYGGKGIKVCEEWLGEKGFATFLVWAIAARFSTGLTIDREDTNKDYCPSNCSWLDRVSNCRKTSRAILNKEKADKILKDFELLTVEQKPKYFIQVAKQTGCTVGTIKSLCYCRNRWN